PSPGPLPGGRAPAPPAACAGGSPGRRSPPGRRAVPSTRLPGTGAPPRPGPRVVTDRSHALQGRGRTGPHRPRRAMSARTRERMRIALFITCVNDTLYPGTGRAAVRLLERLGPAEVFPEAQTCCGQMHYNTGYRRDAQRLAVRFVTTFADTGADAVLAPSASCAAMIRDNYPRLAEEGSRLARATAELAPRVHDLSELLVDVLGVTDVGAY